MELKQSFLPPEGGLRALRHDFSRGTGSFQRPQPPQDGEYVDTPWGFAQILEHIDVGILVFDLKCQAIDYRNSLIDRVFKDPAIGRSFHALYDLLLKDLDESGCFEHSAHINHQISFENRLLGYSVYKTANRYRSVFLSDITEKVRLESIAQAANAMDNIGFIFSGIRHEIGNPLNSLKMALSVLKSNQEQFSSETIDEYIDRGIADIGRMEYLLKSLKTFSLYEHVDFKDLPLNLFMEKFISLLDRDFRSHGIEIVMPEEFPSTLVRVDKRALHQALLNVFNNAAEALVEQQNARIAVGSEQRGQLIWLTIRDNGCGISPEQQEHLFQPFNTNKPDGNGLGLVITRKLLAMMNSDIEIDSQPKQGTQVTISLPVSPDDASLPQGIDDGGDV